MFSMFDSPQQLALASAARAPDTIEEHFAQARHLEEAMTCAFGSHPLAFFGLAPENEHFIAPHGEGLVNYRVTRDVAVVLGDPVCVPYAEERVIQSFLAFCARQNWQVVFYQVYPQYLDIYRTSHFRTFKMGEEAFLNPQTFTLHGSAMANVRTSRRRAEREGVTIQWYEGVLPADVLQQLASLSRTWLQYKRGERATETSFSVGRFDEVNISAERAERIMASALPSTVSQGVVPGFLTAVAMTSTGSPCAFMTFTPIYGGGANETSSPQSTAQGWGWTLDIMRRTSKTPPGVMELLLTGAIERFRACGATVLSLGLVAWSDTRHEISPLQRCLASFVTDHLHLLETHNSLFRFKQKFNPSWESRYLVVRTNLALPRVILGVMRIRNYARSERKRVSKDRGAVE
jgi:lysylphosphatidylglycerol synthetase-like protein (DUF2156 family)